MKSLKFLKSKAGAGLAVLALSASQAANAVIPTEASDAVTELTTDSATFVGSFWPLLIVVTIGFLWMALFKKGTSKAT